MGAGMQADERQDDYELAPRRETVDDRLLRHRAGQLASAAQRGEHGRVQELLEAWADPNYEDERGHLPLHNAAFAGSPDVIRELLRAGADANLPEWQRQGNRSLQIAAWEGHVEAARALLKGKALVDDVDGRGCTPLCSAAGRGHLAAVQMLLSCRASPVLPAVVNGSRLTPFQAASTGGDLRVAQVLREAEAQAEASASLARRPWTRALAAIAAESRRWLRRLCYCKCA